MAINSSNTKTIIRGTVLDNVQTDYSSAISFLNLDTQYHPYKVIYHTEFPPATNMHAGDVGFSLRRGDMVEIYAEVIDPSTISTTHATDCYIRKVNN